MVFVTLVLVSAIAFLYYGVTCLQTARMRAEFERYGLTRYRVATGVLQLLGAVGLIVGFAVTGLGAAAAAGLSALMLLGVGARQRIRDRFLQTLPAAFFAVLNGGLAVAFLVR